MGLGASVSVISVMSLKLIVSSPLQRIRHVTLRSGSLTVSLFARMQVRSGSLVRGCPDGGANRGDGGRVSQNLDRTKTHMCHLTRPHDRTNTGTVTIEHAEPEDTCDCLAVLHCKCYITV